MPDLNFIFKPILLLTIVHLFDPPSIPAHIDTHSIINPSLSISLSVALVDFYHLENFVVADCVVGLELWLLFGILTEFKFEEVYDNPFVYV